MKAYSVPVHKPVPAHKPAPVEGARRTTDHSLEDLGYLRSTVLYPMVRHIKKFEFVGVHYVSPAETMTVRTT